MAANGGAASCVATRLGSKTAAAAGAAALALAGRGRGPFAPGARKAEAEAEYGGKEEAEFGRLCCFDGAGFDEMDAESGERRDTSSSRLGRAGLVLLFFSSFADDDDDDGPSLELEESSSSAAAAAAGGAVGSGAGFRPC